jgi:hypothetical protein
MSKKMSRKKSKYPKKKNTYFTQEHEDAIIKYCKTSSKDYREHLYGSLIQPAFNELVDKIVYTYKFNTLPNSEILKEDCKVFLITILNKFNPDKGHKAFTYFSVITKNWFIAETKKRKKKLQKEVDYEDVPQSIIEEKLVERNTYLEDRSKAEFIEVLHEEIDWWKEETSNDQDRRVLEAVEVLFNSADQIEIFNKKAIYVYLREITGFNTKQITSSLTKIRKKYRGLRMEWDNGEI